MAIGMPPERVHIDQMLSDRVAELEGVVAGLAARLERLEALSDTDE